jgi:tetratricopeptide (TPR) repeat protein
VHPHSSAALSAAAHVAEGLKETDSAERYFKEVTKYYPRQISSWNELGDFYLRWGRKEAKSAFELALELTPDDAHALSGLAAAKSVLGDDAGAARDFERASVLNGKATHPDAMVNLRFADFLQDHEKNAESVVQYERALQIDPDSVDARMGRARSLTRLKQWEPAERDLLICVKDEGKNIQALNLLAKVSQAEGRTEEAQRYAAQAERLSSGAIAQKAANNQIASLLQDAHASMVNKRFAEAAASYRHLLDDHPGVSQAWLELGRCHVETGQIREAESNVRHFLALEETSASGQLLLGRILLRQNQPNGARSAFQRALGIDPLLADARLGIAASYIVEDNFNEAITTLRKFDTFPGVNREARLMLTEALYKNHQPEQALREIDRLLKQDPMNKAAQQMRSSLLQKSTVH